MIRNGKGNSSGRRKIIAEENLDLQERINNSKNGKYIGKHKSSFFSSLNFFELSKTYSKTIPVTWSLQCIQEVK